MQLTKEELKELKNTVERIPQFEEKIGVRLENISFSIEASYFFIYGDFFMDEIDNFDRYSYIQVWATIYDEDNDILASQSATVFKENFLGFETFKICLYDDVELDSIKKIRIYVKTHT